MWERRSFKLGHGGVFDKKPKSFNALLDLVRELHAESVRRFPISRTPSSFRFAFLLAIDVFGFALKFLHSVAKITLQSVEIERRD